MLLLHFLWHNSTLDVGVNYGYNLLDCVQFRVGPTPAEITHFQKPLAITILPSVHWRSAFSGGACQILSGQRNSLMARGLCHSEQRHRHRLSAVDDEACEHTTRKTPKATAKWRTIAAKCQWNCMAQHCESGPITIGCKKTQKR